jgi:hypothetical protein
MRHVSPIYVNYIHFFLLNLKKLELKQIWGPEAQYLLVTLE